MPNRTQILTAVALAGTAGLLGVVSEVRFRAALTEDQKRFDAYLAAGAELRALSLEAFELYITAADPSSAEARRAYELDKSAHVFLDAASQRFRDMYALN